MNRFDRIDGTFFPAMMQNDLSFTKAWAHKFHPYEGWKKEKIRKMNIKIRITSFGLMTQ